jgi:hypothetical protein
VSPHSPVGNARYIIKFSVHGNIGNSGFVVLMENAHNLEALNLIADK